jgi:hypothetical protein
MIFIEVPELRAAQKRLRDLPDGGKKALSKAINDVLVSGQTAAVGDIFERYNLKESEIKDKFSLIKSSSGRLMGIIRVSARRFPVEKFSPTQTDEGIEFEEIRGKKSLIKGAFEATMQWGINVFRRVGAERGPVEALYGLSVVGMTKEETTILPDVKRRIHEQIGKRLRYWTSEALKGKL